MQHQVPTSKLQAPTHSQRPTPTCARSFGRLLGSWTLGAPWSLGCGAWDLTLEAPEGRSPSGMTLKLCGGLELALDRVRDLAGGALTGLCVAPSPLGEIVVAALQPPVRGELIDPLHESRLERQRDVVEIVFRLDLARKL